MMKSKLAEQLLAQTQADYDAIADQFAEKREGIWQGIKDVVEQYVQPGDRVLDLGCGNGRVADVVNEIKAKYLGIDASPRILTIARRLHPHNEFKEGSMLHLGFPDDSFDCVLMIASYHHIPGIQYRSMVMEEVARVTKSGGHIILMNWNLFQWRFLLLWGKFLLKKMIFQNPLDLCDLLIPWKNNQGGVIAERYYHGFIQREIARLARLVDLAVVDQYYETHGQHVPRYRAYNLVSVLQKSSRP